MIDSVQRPADFVHSLERGLAVIRCFSAERPRLTLSEVARQAGLSRAAVRRSLITLQTLGYVGSEERQFYLTPRVLTLGYAYLSSLSVADVAQSHLTDLANEVHESCSASVLDGFDIVYVARAATKRIMTISLSVGTRLPAHATSMGRVLLAALQDDRLDAYLDAATLAPLTERTIVDRVRLRAEVETDSHSRMVLGRPGTRGRRPIHCCPDTRCSRPGRGCGEHQCSCDEGAADHPPEVLPPQASRLRCRD